MTRFGSDTACLFKWQTKGDGWGRHTCYRKPGHDGRHHCACGEELEPFASHDHDEHGNEIPL